ncbi:Eukaryotic-type DNA primase, large subunit [Dictyocaulus viviparus]|uniref:DNA primase large subunit n=1 Tax=Dictyocaulus viviparus TaxID=29172 RepID=A0A0D8XR90_DICVI|nr:Eukaryotic-type DNA primase, large subunit [Dictyocaulus viviparus]
MQFDSGSSKIVRHGIRNNAAKIKASNGIRADHFCNLQLYAIPPSDQISIEEFDEIALERVKVLKLSSHCLYNFSQLFSVVEDMKERYTWGSEEFKIAMTRELSKLMPIAAGTCLPADVERARKRDLIGHFILRLAFCCSPESTKWLVNQEVDLFRFRFMVDSRMNIIAFLKRNDISLDLIDFTAALELVRRRRVLVRHGCAYIPYNDLVTVISSILRANMTIAMARSFKHLAVIEKERLLPRLARLTNNAYSGKQYVGREAVGKITRQMIDELCASSFPPCMQQIHFRLRTDHHLKHGARRQYGLFLKAIGLPLDEAMMFMREEFTKKISSENFEKQYMYNIRHMYGREGRRVDYPAFPCSTIILDNPPAAGDCHGCPFKHVHHPQLAERLEKKGLNTDQINHIINYSKANAFDKACTRFFEYTHKMEEGALGHLITHPNGYFELSQEVLSGARSQKNHLVQLRGTSQIAVKEEENFSDNEN